MTEETLLYEPVNACYWVWEDSRDFLFWTDIHISDLIPLQDLVFHEYNQARLLDWKLSSFCTVVSPIQILSSIYNYEMNDKDWEDLRAYAQAEYWYKPRKWHYIKTWVACACSWWNNKFKDKKILYIRTQLLDLSIIEIRDKNYWVAWWFQWNSLYKKDREDNWIVDWVSFWPHTYWHAVPIYRQNKQVQVRDSYKWRKTNVYWLRDLSWLRKNNVYYPSAYIIVPDPDNRQDEIKKKKQRMDKAIDMHMTMNSQMREAIWDYPWITHIQRDTIRDWLHEVNDTYRELLKD